LGERKIEKLSLTRAFLPWFLKKIYYFWMMKKYIESDKFHFFLFDYSCICDKFPCNHLENEEIYCQSSLVLVMHQIWNRDFENSAIIKREDQWNIQIWKKKVSQYFINNLVLFPGWVLKLLDFFFSHFKFSDFQALWYLVASKSFLLTNKKLEERQGQKVLFEKQL